MIVSFAPKKIFHIFACAAASFSSFAACQEMLDEEAFFLEKHGEETRQDVLMYRLGSSCYSEKNYSKAKDIYLDLANEFPSSPLAGSSLFFAALCSEHLKDDKTKKNLFERCFKEYPKSPHADESYFFYYSWQEYLQGDQEALKHLKEMEQKFPQSPLLLCCWYLIGQDLKRDRKTPEGKWIRKKNLSLAIKAFEKASALFDRFYSEKKLADDVLRQIVEIRYRSCFEKAYATLQIAENASGAKRQIYLTYAKDVFSALATGLKEKKDPGALLLESDAAELFLEEASYSLAKCYLKEGAVAEAESLFDHMLLRYSALKTTKGYFISRIWYRKAMIAFEKSDYPLALECLNQAEDAAKGRVLKTDQKLDLWIKQALCYRALNNFDLALLTLSKAVNDPAISPLRLEAMYLRAETYAKQGKEELAKKQLLFLEKQQGPFALKAKKDLEQKYELSLHLR